MCVGALNHLEGVRRVLIVCPNSLKYNWKEEFEYSGVPWKVVILEGSGDGKAEILAQCSKFARGYPETRQVVVTNYESLTRLAKELNVYQPEVIIADEAHQIKNHKAQKTKALKSIRSGIKWALTGTPLLNNPLDLWSVIDWVRPNYLHGNFYAFRNCHCIIYTGAGFPIIKGYRNVDELKKKVDKVSFRVTKSECLDLPAKVWVERQVELSPAEAKAYTQMAREMVAEIGEEEVSASTMLVKMLRLTQITSGFMSVEGKVYPIGGSKLVVLKELLEELEGQKVVVWAHYKEEVRMIRELCRQMGRPYTQLVAEDSLAIRQQNVEAFQKNNECAQIMIGSVSIGGLGVTLTAAQHCIYFSNTWSQGDRLQSQDRLHRIGQTSKVTYYDLIVPKTIDSYIIKVLKNKAKLADKITGDSARKILVDELTE